MTTIYLQTPLLLWWGLMLILLISIATIGMVQSQGTTQMWYDQKIDHFNAYNAEPTFKQRWFYNDTFWSGAEKLGPLIFQIGGEWTNDGTPYGFVVDFASKINGLILSAEHRWYGESMPFPSSSSSSAVDPNYNHSSNELGLLSIEQSMADFLQLLTFWKSEYFKCAQCPVVVLGGSYSGKLSFYLRLKYPFIFDMALAASAPIFLDSNGLINPDLYYEIVSNATAKISTECVRYVRFAYDVLVKQASPAEITAAIPLCSALPVDAAHGLNELLALLYETWADYSMNNYPPAISPMKDACARVLNGSMAPPSTALGLQIWSRFLAPQWQQSGSCINLTAFAPNGANATVHCSDLTGCGGGSNGESWDYQACTQVIQPLGSNNVTDMFPVWPFNMTWMDAHCESRFGIVDASTTGEYWLATEFGLEPQYFYTKMAEITSRVIFSNGLQDGWSAGGVHQNLSDTLIAINIPNGAHHVDMRGASPFDTQDVIDARMQEQAILTQWVQQLQQKRQAKS